MTKHVFRSVLSSFRELKIDFIKLSLGLVFLMLLGISSSQAQETARGTLKLTSLQMSVEQVCDLITKQLKYDIFYSETEMNAKRMITFSKNEVSVIEALNLISDGKYQYSIKNRTITFRLLTRENQPPTIQRAMGVVKDESGTPLPGVSIRIQGTNQGGSTDVNGRYDLKVPANIENPKLVFTYIGMNQLEMLAGTDAKIVVLKPNVKSLGEVVVTGYEKIDKINLTSSVTTVDMKEIIQPAMTSVDNMLQGKVAGMSVMQQSASVGSAPKIRIRGSSTILGNREPLWVLDGIPLEDPVPLDPTQLNSMDYVNLIGNAISGLNPEDIERIDILKDASSTALYGTKAANGVIVITTKRGKAGKPSIRFVSNTTMIERPDIKDMYLMNSKERIELSEEMAAKGIPVPSYTSGFNGYEGLLAKLYNNEINYDQFSAGVKALKEQNTDWYKLLFSNSISQNNTLTVSGANDVVSYYVSAGYSNQKGAQPEEGSDRYNFMTNFDVKLNSKIRVAFNLNVSNSNTTRPHSSLDLYGYAYKTSRAIAPYKADGTYNFYDVGPGYLSGSTRTPNLVYNILNELDQTGQSSKIFSASSKANIIVDFSKNLKLEAIGSYNVSSSGLESYAGEASYYVTQYRKIVYGYKIPAITSTNYVAKDVLIPFGGILSGNAYKNENYTGRAMLSFNKQFDKQHIYAMAGSELRSSHYTGNTYNVFGYLPERGKKNADIDPAIWTGYAQLLRKGQPSFTDRQTNEASFFASASYTYDNRYILNANVRADASNKLGQDRDSRFLPIWSASGRWNIEREKFMENVTWLTGWNIHSSLGLQGNVTDYHNPNMIVNMGALDALSQQYYSTLNSLPNRGLRWEKTTSFNVGTDLSFLDSRINVSGEYYSKIGRDQLLIAPIESTNGAESVPINYGNVENKGWEVSLTLLPVRTKDWTWNISFNTSKNYNIVTNAGRLNELVLDQYLNGTLVTNGKSLTTFYSYRFGGLDANGYPTYLGIYVKDANGNTVITSRQDAFDKGLVLSGKREPDFTGGLTSVLSYKNFTLNALFSMQLGANIRLNSLYPNGPVPSPAENVSSELVNRWRKPGDEAITGIPAITNVNRSISSGMWQEKGSNVLGYYPFTFYNYIDDRVVSSDFLRCRSISLTYYFEKNLLEMMKLKNANIGFHVTNPFVLKSSDLKGRDPEQVAMGSGALPPLKNYSLSLSITF